MGRGFSAEELTLHRDRWFKTVADNPEILIRAAQGTQTQTGPLEALFAELNFNLIACYGNPEESFPPLAVEQFKRAIATNALASLDEKTKTDILLTYKPLASSISSSRTLHAWTALEDMERLGSGGESATLLPGSSAWLD